MRGPHLRYETHFFGKTYPCYVIASQCFEVIQKSESSLSLFLKA